ncbi:hypothetical protein CFK38_09345 [Brachybacterium vulturis]|uniref:DUF2550 domain-containing protein n=1 Tax=Brachybacterium vulturis TaxID=2017484 RepID=A0A291GNV2_9MICO|nr:DUF2550 family protein [Brachybacterium vulturis]ATG51706.1 hypothetical protein CFK38_09345 [Brachybacterium vulturis]
MNDLSIPILLLGIGMLVVVLAAVLLLGLRQLLVSRSRGAFECTVRRRGLVGGSSWQHGLMRFGTDRLRWFRAFSVRLRPELVLRRSEIGDVSRQRLPAQIEGGEEQYLIEFTLRDGREVSAIVDLASGAALNSWLEAAPTGSVVGDAD